MTQEDKELLLKDLCARLTHGVFMTNKKLRKTFYPLTCEDLNDAMFDDDWDDIPYLRPLSSMTEDERKYIEDKCAFTTMGPIGGIFGLVMPVIAAEWLTDFYNSRHLDWRGLIDKGLALEAPKGMYN